MRYLLVLCFLATACASSMKPNRVPQGARSTKVWMEELVHGEASYEMPAALPLTENTGEPHHHPYATKPCSYDPELSCTFGYSLDWTKRNDCTPKAVSAKLKVADASQYGVAFIDEGGYHVEMACFRPSRGTDPVAITPEVLIACGILKKPERPAAAPAQAVPEEAEIPIKQ